jgi:hypothetical protein
VLSLSLLVVARGASAACGWFGFPLYTAATFDVFYRLQVTNYGVLNILLESTPNRLDYMDVWVLSIHVQTALHNYFVATFLATSPEESKRKSGARPDFANITSTLRASLVVSSVGARSNWSKERPETSQRLQTNQKIREKLRRVHTVRFRHSIAPHLSARELTRARGSPTGTFTAGELALVSAWALHAAWQWALASA